MPIFPIIIKFLSYFWTNFQNVKSTTELQNSQIVKLLAQKTFLEIILVIQLLGITLLLVALSCFVRMSTANFYWFGVLFFWGIPAFFQFSLILRDFVWIKFDNFQSQQLKEGFKINFSRILQDNLLFRILVKKYFVLIIIVNFGLYFAFWLPLLRATFGMPFENGVFGKLGGIGEIISFFGLIWPYFGYLAICGIEYWEIRKTLFRKNLSHRIIDLNIDKNTKTKIPNTLEN